jgi:hypothetical protein
LKLIASVVDELAMNSLTTGKYMYLKSLANHSTGITSISHNSELDPILNKNEKKSLQPTTSRFHIQQQEKIDKQIDLE